MTPEGDTKSVRETDSGEGDLVTCPDCAAPPDPWTIPPEHRPSCPLNGQPCSSWTCLVDVCDGTPVCNCGWTAKVRARKAFDGTMKGHAPTCPRSPEFPAAPLVRGPSQETAGADDA